MNTPVNFEIAKFLKEKGFDKETLHFYSKPNSKMFGIDEHNRAYPIKNISKKLYTSGKYASLKIENVYLAPVIAEVVMWLYEKHGVWIIAFPTDDGWTFDIFDKDIDCVKSETFINSPTEAYELAIKYTLNNLI